MANIPDDDRLTPELKAKWVQALLSGEYKQGRGYLNKEGRYCCLGVLAIVAGHDPEKLTGMRSLGSIDPALMRSLNDHGDSDGIKRAKLENMNDGLDGEATCSFAEIAEWIEENL